MENFAIQTRGLGKKYRTGSSRVFHSTFGDFFTAKWNGLIERGRPTSGKRRTQEFWALRDIDLDIRRGENVGVIGLNGAGKSTFLKLLARITRPTAGSGWVEGRVGALLEVGTGFHFELTGRENTYLYGSILGMGRAEINRKFDEIVAFAEIDQFIDTPVKRYSSGMYVRLAFSVAAHLQPEILLIDEVLAVGDLPFQRKCIDYAKSLQKKDATILFISHNMFSVKTMCERVIYLKGGRLVFDGSTGEGIERYEKDCALSTLSWLEGDSQSWPVIISGIRILDEAQQETKLFTRGRRLRMQIAYRAQERLHRPNFIVAFVRSDGVQCCNYSSELDGFDLGEVSGEGVVEVTTAPLSLVADLYTIHVVVRRQGFQEAVCAQIGGTFHVADDVLDREFGVFHEEAEWCFAEHSR